MSIPITAANFRTVYNSPTAVLRELLPQVFEQMQSPTAGRRFLENYVVSLRFISLHAWL